MEDIFKKEKEKGIDKDTEKKAQKYIKKMGKSLRKDKIISENSKEYIAIGKDFKDASVLSHELGHLDSERSSRKFNKIINNEKLNNITKKHGKKVSNTASILTGFTSGVRSGRKDKSSVSDEVGSSSAVVAASVIPQSRTLSNEAEASRRGYKMLKNKGASKKYLKYSRKKLGGALGTYAASTLPAIAMGLGSREVGRVVGKLTKKNKKKED